jgi:hypothetical protein
MKGKDDKVELKQVFNKLNIWEGEEIEPMQIVDKRTFDILNLYEFYKNSPDRAFDNPPQLWFDSVVILNKTQPRLF